MKYLSVVTVLKTTVKLGGRPLKRLVVLNRSGKQSPHSKSSCMRCLQLEGKWAKFNYHQLPTRNDARIKRFYISFYQYPTCRKGGSVRKVDCDRQQNSIIVYQTYNNGCFISPNFFLREVNPLYIVNINILCSILLSTSVAKSSNLVFNSLICSTLILLSLWFPPDPIKLSMLPNQVTTLLTLPIKSARLLKRMKAAMIPPIKRLCPTWKKRENE